MQQCLLLLKFRLIPYPGSPLAITGLLAVKQKYNIVLNCILAAFDGTLAHCMEYNACSHPFGSFGYCTIYLYQTLQLKENIRHKSVTTESHDFPRLYRNQHSWLGQGDNSLLYIFFPQFKGCNNHHTGPLDIFIMYITSFPSVGSSVCIWLQVLH